MCRVGRAHPLRLHFVNARPLLLLPEVLLLRFSLLVSLWAIRSYNGFREFSVPQGHFMSRFSTWSLRVALAALVLAAMPAMAQGDPSDTPLGDVARNLRKKTPPSLPVIDDDNFSQVMDQVESEHMGASSLHFSMPTENKSFQVAQTDVTCSLSFSANAKLLLSNQYAEMKLPRPELVKLLGPANIEGRALNVSLTNGTDWHLSEVAIAFTVVRKSASTNDAGEARMFPPPDPSQESAMRTVKTADKTVIYRMRAAASPTATTVFRAPLDVEIDSGDEWHWAIVEAKGYPPQGYSAGASELASGIEPPIVVPSSLKQFDPPASVTLHHDPQ